MKQPLVEHQAIRLDKLRGLYSRGITDAVPPGYFIESRNLQFREAQVYSRNGTEVDFSTGPVRRFFVYKRLNEAARYLWLDNVGNFYDSLYPNSPLVTNAEFVDFSAVNYNNRAYITFHNRIQGVTNSYLYVYQGAGPGTMRFAAGQAPSEFALQVENSTESGNIEAGLHLYAIAFESDTGFISAPGPEIFPKITAPGDRKVYFPNLPIGPAGTRARWIIGTQAINPTIYDGNQMSPEYFFIERIGDNTTTTATVNYWDADLYLSADYLFDNRDRIPAGLGVAVYGTCLVTWGIPAFEHYVFVSKPNDPEAFNAVDGYMLIDPSDSGYGVRNCIEHRGQLHILKPNRAYATTGIFDVPANTWQVVVIDKAIGTEVFGISKLLDAKGVTVDRFFLADKSGLLAFEASVYRKPEVTWLIEDWWQRINKNQWNLVQVDHDPENSVLYISVPLDDATDNSHIFMGDYKNALPLGYLDVRLIKWSIWDFPYRPSAITIDYNPFHEAVLKIGSLDGNILLQKAAVHTDNLIKIVSVLRTGLLTLDSNWINHFASLKFRIEGFGLMKIDLFGINGQIQRNTRDLIITPAPSGLRERWINLVNEKISIRLTMDTNANDHFLMHEMTVWAKLLWASRASA